MQDAPPPPAPPPDQPVPPRTQTVRVTAPDLARRAAMEKTRSRLLWTAAGFALLYGAVGAKLTNATILFPVRPHRAEHAVRVPKPKRIDNADGAGTIPPAGGLTEGAADTGPHVRATITDRNGEILAISLPTAALYANPREIMDPAGAARKLKHVLPRLNEAEVEHRLSEQKQFVYLERQITPREQLAVNAQGIPGIYFQPSQERRYPLGRVAAQVLGGTDVDGHGVAGVEKAFNKRLSEGGSPLRLSIDVRVQGVMRDELSKSMAEFTAIGACGIVMDVRTGEVIAMVSLPDYDANNFGDAPATDRFNRAITGMYEPGSTFKLQTASVALDDGVAHIWDQFDAAHPIHFGRFTITDFEGKHRMLYLPEVLAYSSNLGAAHIADEVGADRQRAWLKKMGMFNRVGIQLPEQGLPIVPPESRWKQLTTMTVGFGHGIAVSPLHVVRGTAAIANGGVLLRPTILDMDAAGVEANGVEPAPKRQIMQRATSDMMRRLMRLVVTNGYGKPADVPGYFVGGKTGTAEKIGAHGYKKHTNVSAFMSVFPMNAPRYAVYFMLDEPHGTKETGGFSTAGAVSAPGAGRVIARIGPMLGVFPETADAAAIQASLSIPMEPARGLVLRSAASSGDHLNALPESPPSGSPAPADHAEQDRRADPQAVAVR